MQLPLSTRRRFLQACGCATAAALLPDRSRSLAGPGKTQPETKIISLDAEHYHGWPTVARRRSGQLVITYSGGREGHVCPFGRVEMIVSNDDGSTWTYPRVLLNDDIDDRDSGVLETSHGSLLVTTFTSLAYEAVLDAAEKKKAGDPGAWPPERLRLWQAARDRLTLEQRKAQLGQWLIRSTDGGQTWSARLPTIVNSPHGPIELRDGRLLYAGKELWTGEHRIGVCESQDDGQTWKWLAEVPTREGDRNDEYHELHAVEVGNGRIIAQIRNENAANSGETLQSESSDGGKTWTVPHSIGVWGLPSHLMKLRSGRLLMTYGHRRPPFGNQARVSDDGGKTWGDPMLISADGVTGDLGYPSTAELGDGTLLTVWYETMNGSPRGSAAGTVEDRCVNRRRRLMDVNDTARQIIIIRGGPSPLQRRRYTSPPSGPRY